MRRTRAVSILFIAILTATYCVLLALDLYPALRGPDEWRWAYGQPGTYRRLWLPALLFCVHTLVSGYFLYSRKRPWLALLWVVLFTPLLQLGLLYMDHPDPVAQLFYRVISHQANGFLQVGAVSAETETHTFLANFVANMPSYPIHPQRHPPGLSLLYLWTHQLIGQFPQFADQVGNSLRGYQCHNFDIMYLPNTSLASAILQLPQPVYAGLMALPLYRFAQRFSGERVALLSVLIWPLLPGVALWSTTWNILYGVFTIGVLLLIMRGLTRRALWCFVAAGILLSLATFFTFGNILIIGLAGTLALVWLAANWKQRPPWGWLILAAALCSFGISSIWLFAWLYAGLNPFDVFDEAMSTHLNLNYDYWTWVVFHPWDFFVFLGVPLALLWVYATGHAVWKREKWQSTTTILAIAFCINLLVMIFSGTSQGEVARVWAFLYPMALVIAVSQLSTRPRVAIWVIGLVGLQSFVGNTFLRLHDTTFVHPPAPPPVVEIAGDGVASWASGMTLLLVDVESDGRDRLDVVSTWTASKQISQPYTQFTHLLDAEGKLVAQQDSMLLGGLWPTTCWERDVGFAQKVTLPIGDVPDGRYQLVTGWYFLPTGERDRLIDHSVDMVVIARDIEIR